MSRIGKLPININDGIQVSVEGSLVRVTGPKGALEWRMPAGVKIQIQDNKVQVETPDLPRTNLLGLSRTLIANMIAGVTTEWTRIIELSGTGYRATVSGDTLQLALGFSHPVNLKAPAGIAFEAKDNKITVRGADRELVGRMAAKIRGYNPADPYKAKGFKYEGEVIVRKAGKAAKTGAAK